jgi:hypothetical protein
MPDYEQSEIEAHFARWREAVDRRDLPAMASMLAEDAKGGNASIVAQRLLPVAKRRPTPKILKPKPQQQPTTRKLLRAIRLRPPHADSGVLPAPPHTQSKQYAVALAYSSPHLAKSHQSHSHWFQAAPNGRFHQECLSSNASPHRREDRLADQPCGAREPAVVEGAPADDPHAVALANGKH